MARQTKKPTYQYVAIVPVASFAFPKQKAKLTSKRPAIIRIIQFIDKGLFGFDRILTAVRYMIYGDFATVPAKRKQVAPWCSAFHACLTVGRVELSLQIIRVTI